MAVNIAIECRGGPRDGHHVRIDQHADLPETLSFNTIQEPGGVCILACDYFYSLEEADTDAGWSGWYQFKRALKRTTGKLWTPASDQWPEPPIDEVY